MLLLLVNTDAIIAQAEQALHDGKKQRKPVVYTHIVYYIRYFSGGGANCSLASCLPVKVHPSKEIYEGRKEV